MDDTTENAMKYMQEFMTNIEQNFLTQDRVEYDAQIQKLIDALLKKKGWKFKPSEVSINRCVQDDVIVSKKGKQIGVIDCVRGTYPYYGDRLFLNQLQLLARDLPTTEERDVYDDNDTVSETDKENHRYLRRIHDESETLLYSLTKYRNLRKINVPANVSGPETVLDPDLCTATTLKGKFCKRSRTRGTDTCYMHSTLKNSAHKNRCRGCQ
jgi:hypothetical protein